MSKNGIVLSVLAVILAGFYLVFFTDLFTKDIIEIVPQIRPNRRASSIPRLDPSQAQVFPVSFMLRGKYKLTSVKVVAADDLATNKHPTPLWHMVADSNSVPTKAFFYGERIRGMKPAIPKTRPMPLDPNINYIVMLEAGRARGQTNFHTREAVLP